MTQNTEWEHLMEIVTLNNSGNMSGVIEYISKNIEHVKGQVLSAALNSIDLTPDFVTEHKEVLSKIIDSEAKLDLRDSVRMGYLISLLEKVD